MSTAISVTGLNKSYNSRKVLESISFRIEEGEFVALIGPSGSGKSTLLRHIAGFVPADGKTESCITVGNRIVQQRGRIMPGVRKIRSGIGFIFQQFNLAGRLPLIVNVLTGMLSRVPAYRSLLRWFTRSEVEEGLGALRQVGMADHAWQRTSTLSGGQQQRAAIARSLVQNARVILADEPIASLDPESARNVMDILARINRDCGHTVLVSLHQVDVAVRYCSRVIALQMGKIVHDGPSQVLAPELSRKLYESVDSGRNEVGSAPGVPAHGPRLDPKAAEALG